MKKIVCFFLVFISFFSIVACSKTDLSPDLDSLKDEISSLKEEIDTLKEKEQSKLPDFADCEIGYMLEVYPQVAFDYKVSEDCVVHIESITATLTAKNVINEGDLIEEAFDRFIITFNIKGSAPIEKSTKHIYIHFKYSISSMTTHVTDIIDISGDFEIDYTIPLIANYPIYFSHITIS